MLDSSPISSNRMIFAGNTSFPCADCLDRAVECVVTARRRPRPTARQNSEPADLSDSTHKVEDSLQAPAEANTTPTVNQITPGPNPSPKPSNHPTITKSPTFIYHHLDGQVAQPLADIHPSPAVHDEQKIEDEGSSVCTAEAVCSYNYITIVR